MRNIGRDLTLLACAGKATATGTTLATTPVVDITGYDGVIAYVSVNVTATGNRLYMRGGTASGTLGDIAGSWSTAHTSVIGLEIYRPQNIRYVDAVLQSSASGQNGNIWLFGYGARAKPATGNASYLTMKFVNQPVTGTATSS